MQYQLNRWGNGDDLVTFNSQGKRILADIQPQFFHFFNGEIGVRRAFADYGEAVAARMFTKVLATPIANRLSQCQYCGTYFAYERTRWKINKRGCFLPRS